MKHSHEDHCRYMRRCLQLAALGRGHVSPNPMVGAVVVHKGKIIGEGYHRRCGEAHAEVNAIRSVKNEELLREFYRSMFRSNLVLIMGKHPRVAN